jgi:SAM-dependent methyltransferase
VILYALTLVLSAFLLFHVQPIIARAILPWFGGSAGVWTTCLVFFQSVLLLGYLYAHGLCRWMRPRLASAVHIVLLLASLAVLPVLPAVKWKPVDAGDPAVRILLLLAVTLGLPYFLLSATSPLLQAWYSRRSGHPTLPYRLYALSNAGSMFALVSYPAIVEPLLGTRAQALSWSWAYGAFVLLCAAAAFSARNLREETLEADTGSRRLTKFTYFCWIALPACASILLLAVTNHLSQNVAAIPFLWVLPLSLYLLSFILCFEGERWYARNVFLRLFAVAVGGMAYALSPDFENAPIKIMIPFFAAALFVCCMVCHGELVRLKPHPSRLTSFYVAISCGGALGGVFVALFAPRVFTGFYELPVGIAATAALLLAVLRADPASGFGGSWRRPAPLAAGLLTLAVIGYLGFLLYPKYNDVRVRVRNFYGGLRVTESIADDDDDDRPVRLLAHGTITHGAQFLDEAYQNLPTTYYGPGSGVGLAIRQLQAQGPIRVGVIGLGAGTLAAYGRAGDYYRFYEINPLVPTVARTQFTFLKNSKAHIDVAMGDARLSLEREPPQQFDVLVIDAFSSDAIPIHLLTREAFALYFRQLKDGGVLAVHVSNKHLNLKPVVQAAADALHKQARVVEQERGRDEIWSTTWVLVTGRGEFFDQPLLRDRAKPVPPLPRLRLWTDDYSNLFGTLK